VSTCEVAKRTPEHLKRDPRTLGTSAISDLGKLSPAHCRQLDRDMPPRVVEEKVIRQGRFSPQRRRRGQHRWRYRVGPLPYPVLDRWRNSNAAPERESLNLGTVEIYCRRRGRTQITLLITCFGACGPGELKRRLRHSLL
jgi:hypothetical protein